MGTMEVITLDDTVAGSDTSTVFFIDESPMAVATNDATVSPSPSTRKRKRKDRKKKNAAKKNKTNLDLSGISRANWVILGSSKSYENVRKEKNQNNSETSSAVSKSDSCTSSILDGTKSSLETIVIPSDDEDIDVIELSDEEVGVIGGELSTLGTSRLDYIQRNRNNNNKFWSKKKKNKASQLAVKKSALGSSSKEKSLPRKLRPIIVDGSNVAFGHGAQGSFSSKGIEICCNYFLERGHLVKVFVPWFRKSHRATSDTHILDRLEKEKILIFTPSRKVDGKFVVSYDDRFIVEYAAKFGGVIVSRDNFKDLASENSKWKDTVNNRLLMYTWVDDMIMFPQDPLGRNGPSLEDFLSFPPGESDGESITNTN